MPPSVHSLNRLFRLETREYLQAKFEDHRSFSTVMFALSALLGPSLWVWDHVTDPVGARDTMLLRLLFLSYAVFPIAFQQARDWRWLAAASMAAMLAGEVVFGEITNRLHGGDTFGVGAFLIFIYAPLLLFIGFSLRLNLVYLLLAAALPHGLAWIGFIRAFHHDHYAVLIWPTVFTLAVGQFAYAHNYQLRRRLELALLQASNTDPLTGVVNRRAFLPALRQELERSHRYGRKVALLMIDIDHFKRINDTHGHPSGDIVIRALAETCTRLTRKIDVVARMGGEEFAILLPETTVADAALVADRIRATLSQADIESVSGARLSFTVSIGVAEQPRADESEETLIHLADAALYCAKERGRNRVELAGT